MAAIKAFNETILNDLNLENLVNGDQQSSMAADKQFSLRVNFLSSCD